MTGAATQYLKLLDLKGRGFVVLGAGQGIGEQAAHALAQAGASVVCVDNDSGRAEAVAQDVHGHACRGDVTQRSDMERIFGEAKVRLGAVTGIVDIVGIARISMEKGLEYACLFGAALAAAVALALSEIGRAHV